MNQVQSFNFGNIAVSFREDGYLNATQIASHFGKQARDYLKTEQTQQYITALAEFLSVKTKILTKENQVVIVKRGGSEQGTWLHPKLAIHFARWLDPKFAVWCDEQIEALLNGKVSDDLPAKTTVDERTPLRQAVSALVGLRRVDYSTAYNMVHQRFGVEKIEDLPREVLPEAVRYVHALTLDNALSGEVLEKLERPSENITFSQGELRELAAVTYYCAWACRLLRDVAAPLAALGYEKAVTMRTLPVESAGFLPRVHKALLREMPKINSAFEREDMQNSLSRCGFLM